MTRLREGNGWPLSLGGAARSASIDSRVAGSADCKRSKAIATAAMRLVLDALQQVFVRNLAKDYERWVTDEGYRASRAEQSVPGPRHSSSSKQ